jgi:hypothetical protein
MNATRRNTRVWTDEQLRAAVASTSSSSHIERADVRPALPQLPKRPNWVHLRSAAESIAVAWFAIRGMAMAVPSYPREYDLLVTFDDGIKRVQVESSTCRTRNGTWQVGVGRRPYSLDKTAGIAPYDPDMLDYFFIIDGDGAVYLIPSQVLAGRTGIYVRMYADYCVGDASSLFASSDIPAAPISEQTVS